MNQARHFEYIYRVGYLLGKDMLRYTESHPYHRWWDLFAVFLLFLCFTIVFKRLYITQWTDHLEIVRTVTYCGLISGLALGHSRFTPRTIIIFSFIYGVYIIPWQIGLDFGSGIPWNERLLSLWIRLQIIFNHIIQRKPILDNLLFLLLMCILFWILSAHAGYTLTRYAEPWRIIVPAGVALIIFHSYDQYFSFRVWYLIAYLLFSLLLVVRLIYLHNRYFWEKTHTYVPPNIGNDIMRIACIGVLILLLFSWVAPAQADSFPKIAETGNIIKQHFRGIQDTFKNAFAALKSSVGIVNDYYGSSLTLGRGNRLNDSEVFIVLSPPNPPPGTRYYWRARVYDFYEDGKWSSTLNTNIIIDPELSNLFFPKYSWRASGLYTFFFTTAIPISTLYIAPQPEWVSVQTKAELVVNPDGTSDISAYHAIPALQAGDTYYVRSSLSGTTVKTLRESVAEYPTWIMDRYLQLPVNLSSRTIELAKSLTAELENPYDKVMAITNYLRQYIEYQESIPQFPDHMEPIDWFLFDYRKGFCNYYATAEVLLLRSIGIPARFAVGYAEGEYQEVKNAYIVRQRDAHAWPEVYFSNLGWIEFEPTSSQPAIIKPSGEAVNNTSNGQQFYSDNLKDIDELNKLHEPQKLGNISIELYQRNKNIILILGLIALLIILTTIIVIRNHQLGTDLVPFPVMVEKGFHRLGIKSPPFLVSWSRQSALTGIERAYQEINSALDRLGKKTAPAKTPRERSELLISIIPETTQPVEQLLCEYEIAAYSPQPPNINLAKRAATVIKALSYRKRIQYFFYSPNRKS